MKKRDRYFPAVPAVPMATYRAHQGEIALHLSHFLLDYLRGIYEQFEGDLAMAIVLGEIAHHNMGELYADECVTLETVSKFHKNEAFREGLPACNAYSLAAATGLPRETVRRKIKRLEELGWVARGPRRELHITPRLVEHFQPDINPRLVVNLLRTADRIRGVLTPGGDR